MKTERLCIALLVAGAALLASVEAAPAQTDSTVAAKPKMTRVGGGYLAAAMPSGDWGKTAGFGLALDGTDVYRPRPDSPWTIRSCSGLLYNFSRTVDVPAANLNPGDKLEIETSNWSLTFGLGPEFSKPNKAVTPFVFGVVGFDTYWTSSELHGTAVGAPYSAEHGDSRLSFAWGAGGGVRRQVEPNVQMELSVEYRSGSDHEYLRPEDVSSSSAGVLANRQSQRSDQWILRIGAVLSGAALKD
jgi:opacity protein-like surface antigen